MDKITKLLKKLNAHERNHLEQVLEKLISGDTKSLDIKKLKGVENIYRVRVGSLRIIFHLNSGAIRILEISRRDENTYRPY